MRVAATDDTLRPGPLATPARDGHHDGGVDQPTPEDGEQEHRHRFALARELGALACAVSAVALISWSLFALLGWPALGLVAAALLGLAARVLGYNDPSS